MGPSKGPYEVPIGTRLGPLRAPTWPLRDAPRALTGPRWGSLRAPMELLKSPDGAPWGFNFFQMIL
jgi:hypothetical protein